MKFININFIKSHPIWTIWITTFIMYLFNAVRTGNPNPAGYFVIGLFLMALFSPLIKRSRQRKENKENMDYLAKRIAEEQNK